MKNYPVSTFDIYKIGVGPSSSHTMGPWKAVLDFLTQLENEGELKSITKISIELYGSLAKTGKGHCTDTALLMGLLGKKPETIDTLKIQTYLENINTSKKLTLLGQHEISFDLKKDLLFTTDRTLPYHPNALEITATTLNQTKREVYYSIGGGFILKDSEKDLGQDKNATHQQKLPFPVNSSKQLLHWCHDQQAKISEVTFENEKKSNPVPEIYKKIDQLWEVMQTSIFQGCHEEGFLPGGLNVSRRASTLNSNLLKANQYHNLEEWTQCIKSSDQNFQNVTDWISCFALAVNEVNASMGRIVTAPTNGAAGVIPTVLMYFKCFCKEFSEEKVYSFFLTSGEIGSLFKKGATISAAAGGCQAEIGVSSAMAAAGLTEVLGGTPEQAVMAAEIAMEHHLGLTCDPVGGLVQIPCIERNSMGAIKAITAAQIALKSRPKNAKVSLDNVIATMWKTAQDMSDKYKETSEGGLAHFISVNLQDC